MSFLLPLSYFLFLMPIVGRQLGLGFSGEHLKAYVAIRLSFRPEKKLKVGGFPLIKTIIERENEGYVIRIGHIYISARGKSLDDYDELGFSRSKFHWGLCDSSFGAKIHFMNNCWTYQRNKLVLEPCAADSDFRGALQIFDIKKIVKEEDSSRGHDENLNLVGNLDSSVEGLRDELRALMKSATTDDIVPAEHEEHEAENTED